MNHDSQDQHGLPVKWCCETITTIFRRVPCWSKAMIPTVLSSYKRSPSWGTPGRRRSCRVCLPTSLSRLGPARPFSACEAWGPRTTSCGACWPMSWGAWAVLIGLADISEAAWRKRLRASNDWLLWLLGELSAVPEVPAPSVPRPTGRLLLVDASCLRQPGGTGDDWRLHLAYDPMAGRLPSAWG